MNVALAAFAALALAMGIGRFAFTPVLPMMQADAGLSLEQGAWLSSANYAGYLAGAASAAWMAPGLAIGGGLAAIGLATLAMGLLDGMPAWTVLRFAAGVASGWVMVQVSAWALERLAPLNRPFLGGVLYTGVGAGVAVTGLVCLASMALGLSSSAAWLVLGAIATMGGVLLARSISAGSPVRGDAPAAPIAWRLVIAYGIYGFGYIIPATFIPAMAKEIVADPLVFGWAWPAFGAAAMASTLAAGLLARHIGNRAIWIVCQLVLAFGVAAPALLAGMPGILLASFCVGATFVTITQAGLQEARRLAGQHAARPIAALTAAFAIGQIAGPPFVALWLRRGGTFDGALLFAAALSALATLPLFGKENAR